MDHNRVEREIRGVGPLRPDWSRGWHWGWRWGWHWDWRWGWGWRSRDHLGPLRRVPPGLAVAGDVGFCCWEDSEGAGRRGVAETWALGKHRADWGRRRGAGSGALGPSAGFGTLTPGESQQPGVFGSPVLEPHLGRDGTGGKCKSGGAASSHLCPGVRLLRCDELQASHFSSLPPRLN